MGIRSFLAKPLAAYVACQVKKWSSRPLQTQEKVFRMLMKKAQNTRFGKDHHFSEIKNYADFKKHVPVRDYEGLKIYIDKVKNGEPDILWPGKPIYFCKTSGTTSGTKYIPISKESISNHINSARDALLLYIHATGNARFLDGNLIFLSGSPELNDLNGIPVGRLSGIVNHHVPSYLRSNQLPSYPTNCLEDWESKVDAIVDETISRKMTLISGIPSWVQMYFEKLIARSEGKQIKDIFPDFSLFVYGGVNFEPYRNRFMALIGREIDSIETFPASEGFIAYQDCQPAEGLLLILDSGIFYEFIPADEYFNENPTRLSIGEVKTGVNYALIMNTNAGLWGYSIGDTIKFVSLKPYRLIVTGRIKHFTSAFGEHVIAEEVEGALRQALQEQKADVVEFSVAPQVSPPEGGMPYHEWFVEFSGQPSDPQRFRMLIDEALQKMNPYYKDLIQGNILRPLVIRVLAKDSFVRYMKSEGKLGGQNKVARLSNDRNIADALKKDILQTWN